MADKNVYICSACGFTSPKWLGKCPECESWNTLEETHIAQKDKQTAKHSSEVSGAKTERLKDVKVSFADRFSSGSEEFDRVLGGGIVPASIALVGGDPGIGKSTLLLQTCDFVSQKGKVLYISAEESAHQIKLRADRLACRQENVFVAAETDIDEICALLEREKPLMAVVDSIQTVYAPYLSSAPGTVTQVRECATRLMRIAKKNGICVFTVGHVTKEGTLAGPKVLEHIVDTVMYFEGEKNNSFRVLRTNKNRFGSTNEIGVFEMTEDGMRDVKNPSEIFLSERKNNVAGIATLCSIEGTRPITVEIQALTSTSGYGNARRVCSGVDYNRMIMLLAVLEKRLGYKLYDSDVFVNVAGGLKIDEPASDLAIIAAIASAQKNVPIDAKTVMFGEVGLTGFLRAVNSCQQRINECIKLGFERVILPSANKRGIKNTDKINIIFADSVYSAFESLRSK